jgi:hypothetical protein
VQQVQKQSGAFPPICVGQQNETPGSAYVPSECLVMSLCFRCFRRPISRLLCRRCRRRRRMVPVRAQFSAKTLRNCRVHFSSGLAGAVASATLTTVDNDWYEVEGGHEVRVTVVYLSRAWRWEEALPEETQRQLVPESPGARRDMAKLRLSGEFAGFPNFDTSKERYSARQSNALSQLSSWVMRTHEAQLQQTLLG